MEPTTRDPSELTAPPARSSPPQQVHPRKTGSMLFGLLLMFFGMLALSNAFGWGWFSVIPWWKVWPALLIVWGAALLLDHGRSAFGWILLLALVALLMLLFSARSAGFSIKEDAARTTPVRVERMASMLHSNTRIAFGGGTVEVAAASANVELHAGASSVNVEWR